VAGTPETIVITATPAPEAGEEDLLEKVKRTGALVIGTGSYPPNTFVDAETGEWVGFDMDFLKAFAENMGVDPFITYMPASALVPALKSGRIDIWVDLYYTEERAKELAFSDVWTCYTDAVVVNSEDSTIDTPTVEAMGGKKIATCRGCAEEPYIDGIPGAEKVLYDTVEETFLEVSSGRIDAAFQPLIYVEWGMRQNPDWNIEPLGLVPPELIPGGKQLTASYYGVKKGPQSESFLSELNAFLKDWRESGKMEESFARYGLVDEVFFLPTCELD
jgi:ABC-type amino acid transport substrate-binding protein